MKRTNAGGKGVTQGPLWGPRKEESQTGHGKYLMESVVAMAGTQELLNRVN